MIKIKCKVFQIFLIISDRCFRKTFWRELCAYFSGGRVELALKSGQSEAPNGHQERVNGHPEEEKVFVFFIGDLKGKVAF